MSKLFIKRFAKYFLALMSLAVLSFSVAFTMNPSSAKAACVAGMPTNLMATAGTMPGTVKLTWNSGMNTNRFALVYGYTGMPYMFGSLNVDGAPNLNYTVTHLSPGTKYSFQVWAFCSKDGPATPSNEVSIMAPK